MISRDALTLDLRDLARLRRAVAQAKAVGGDLGWLGEKLAGRLESLPQARVSRRDAALVVLGQCYIGSDRTRARDAAADLARYAVSRWRSERALLMPPATAGDKGRALFAVLKESPEGEPPGFETIRKAWVKNKPVSITHDGGQESTLTRRRGRDMRFMSAAQFEPANVQPDEMKALAALARQPETQRIVSANHARIVAERQARLDRIAQLDAAAEKNWPKAQKAEEAAIEKVREAERALRDANAKAIAAENARAAQSYEYTRARAIEEMALIDGSDTTVIGAWRTELFDLQQATLRPANLSYSEVRSQNNVTMKGERAVYSNSRSIARRSAVILELIRGVDALALEADQTRLPDIISDLRKSIPDIDDVSLALSGETAK